MAKKEKKEITKVTVSIYPEEFATVEEEIEKKVELLGTALNSRDIRAYFGLKPTHRGKGVKGLIKEEVEALSEEEQKELLEEIRKRKQ